MAKRRRAIEMVEPAATWLYAVVPGETTVPGGLRGVADEPVGLIRRADLAVVVGAISLTVVGPEQLPRQLQDPAWLEQAVRAHHQVVSAFFQHGPTVPFRLATVYQHDERVRELLDERGSELLAALSEVTDRAEWGVQAYAGAPEPVAPAEPDPSRKHRPGTAYLLARRAAQTRQEHARAVARDAAQQLDATLTGIAAAAHRPASPPRSGDGAAVDLILNTSYLVDNARAEEFTGSVHKLADQLPHLRLRLTGPWPAYSFVEIAGAGR